MVMATHSACQKELYMQGKGCFPILNETLSGQQNMFKPARSSPQEYLQGRVEGITDQIIYSVRINTCFDFWMGGTGGSCGAWGFYFLFYL